MVRKVDWRIALPALAVVSGLALRAARLSFQPLWWDEGYSAWFATHSLPAMARLTAEDIHPPLYYALLHLWTQVFGPGPVSLRLLSVVFGVLAIPVIYLAARRILGSRPAAAIAALLLALSPLHIYYSQEVRMYGLVALLSAGILWAAWETLQAAGILSGAPEGSEVEGRLRHGIGILSGAPKGSEVEGRLWHGAGILSGAPAGSEVEGRLRPALAYILLVTLALYTQYYAVFLPIGLTLYALWHWRRNGRALLRWLGLNLIAALLYLPWVIYAAPRLTLYVSQKVVHDADRPLGPLAYLARHLAAFTAGHLEGPLAPFWPLALVLLIPIVAGLFLALRGAPEAPFTGRSVVARRLIAGRKSPGAIAFLLTVLVTALVLGWLIGLRYPFFPDRGERLLLLALPAFVMLLAAGIDALWRVARPLALGSVALLVLASTASLAAFYTVPRYPEDDYRPLIARTVEQGLPGDTVLAVYPWQVGYWRSYAAGIDGPTATLIPAVMWGPELEGALDDALSSGRVWFPAHLSLGGLLETEIEQQLGRRAVPFANTWYGAGTRLSAWTAQDTSALDAWTNSNSIPTARYFAPSAHPLLLQGVWLFSDSVPAANAVIPLALLWQFDDSLPDLTVSVRLVDDLDQIWAQHDYGPLGRTVASVRQAQSPFGEISDRLGLLVPAGTPPGRYRVELVVSPTDDPGSPLVTAMHGGGEVRDSLRLFDLEVMPADRALGPERLPIANRAETQLADGIRFLGYTVDPAPLAPGDSRRVNLFWQATAQPSADYTAFVQALGRDGAPLAGWEAAPGAAFPTSQWMPGALIRTQATIRFPAETPDGRYPLIAGLYNPVGGQRLKTERGAEQVALGSLSVQGRPHNMNPPSPRSPADVTFGNVARLVGYDLDENASGGALTVTLQWQALGASDRPLTVFVHALDENEQIVGYGDSEPGSGAYPTTGWLTGEYLADVHTVTFSTDTATAQLAVGLYDPATGERLLTNTEQDEFLIVATP